PHFFLLSSHRPLRHLHSFPTRRSSDLAAAPPHSQSTLSGFPPEECPRPAKRPSSQASSPHAFSPASRAPNHCRRPTSRRRDGREDRKSTRLNSSHLVISYAVFCLKKKK